MQNPLQAGLIPRPLKLLYVLWIALWIPIYWIYHGPQNFLWMCDTVNILLLFALCFEMPMLLSAQAVGVLLVHIVWTADFLAALLLGIHLVGGTEYMFDVQYPLWLRAMSLFHIVLPPLLLWGVSRLGYDHRGWKLQTLLVWILLPITFLVADPALNINWLWKPFEVEQTLMPPIAFLPVMMLAYPLILFLPTHLVLKRSFRQH